MKSQFAKVFVSSDWRLFKEMAEINLSEAAFLKKSSKVAKSRRLLARNSRKRLLIGVGLELLLKAVYLKADYCINKPQDRAAPLRPPFRPSEAVGWQLEAADTYTLEQLTRTLKKILQMQKPQYVIDGLSIAKVFRNKEGHVVTRAHRFDAKSYRMIEGALREIYANAFQEQLTVRFSFERRERGC
ncbi:MAG TPA: hypothetical protein VK747_04585 [Blastocatellia bacterium]|nr:hypothetical protein [Blastocatellia bacterium]